MKPPRVADFDPHAEEAPSLRSPMDRMPSIEQPATKHPRIPGKEAVARQPSGAVERPAHELPANHPAPASHRTADDPSGRTTVRSDARQITRYAFEFYQDQIDRLRHISLEDKLRGGKRSMSEMVREAVDRYLADEPADR